MKPRQLVVDEFRCLQLAARITSYVDGELPPTLHAQLAEHLEHCRRCGMKVAEYDQLKTTLTEASRRHELFPHDQAPLGRLVVFAATLTAQP